MTNESSDALLRVMGGRSKVKILQGTFVAATGGACTVDVAGSRIPAILGTSFVPEVNEAVFVWNVDEQFFVMGPIATKPDRGTVQSVSGGLVTLTTALGTTVTCPYAGTTPSAGQIMKILWHGGPFAMLMSTSPAGNTPPVAPGTPAVSHTDTFTAIDAGSYGSGRWWTSQVYASDSNLGAWFYGSKIADTIPSSAVISSIQVFIPGGSQIQGSAPNFALHPYGSNPGVSPSFSGATAVSVAPGWVALPASFATALKSGGGSAGIGVAHGGYNIFPSLAQDGMSGALQIVSTY